MLQKFSAFYKRCKTAVVGGSLVVVGSVVAPMARAQTAAPTIDTTSVTTFLQENVITGIAAIGGIMLLVAVVFAGYRWVRGAAGGN